ncbi:HEAT repeat domain-containing protein [Methanoculleus bourgensis]|uniref:HEAT repeat domain-containing protein n=1 Tax=Methanoculleus bourgensis TaxID=83986 RepID=UPI0024912C63|nr:HEAT repeat domain-containing protein [Methanoculleus bourgensis]
MIQPANERLDVTGEVRKSLQVLFAADQVIEVRTIAKSGIRSGYFKDTKRLVQVVEALDTDPYIEGIYVVLNRLDPSLLARRANRVARLGRSDSTTGDADIIKRRWFPVDIDPKRAAGISASDEEHDNSLKKAETVASWLQEIGFPEPVIGDSGNGAHLLYRIDLPNTNLERDLIRKCLESIAFFHSDESCAIDTGVFNAARIWKLYGTVARKGDSIPERPHRRSQLISTPRKVELVEREVLEHLASLLPDPEYITRQQSEQHRTVTDVHGKKHQINLREWFTEHGINVRKEKTLNEGILFDLEQCPFSDAHRSGAYAIQFTNRNIFAGCFHNSCGSGAQRWPELRGMYGGTSQQRQSPSGPLSNSAHYSAQVPEVQQCTPQNIGAVPELVSPDSSVPSRLGVPASTTKSEPTLQKVKIDPRQRDIDGLLLLCVYLIEKRSSYLFGRDHVVKILLGSTSKKVFSHNHNELAVFGEGRYYGKGALKRRLEELIVGGYITQIPISTASTIRVLKLTPRGHECLARLRPDKDEEPLRKDIQELIEDLSSISYMKRRNAAEMLGNYGDSRAVDPLIQALSNEDRGVVYASTIALSKLRDPKAVGPLLLLLNYPEPAVQGPAIYALGEIGDRKACEYVAEFLRNEDLDLVKTALDAIVKLKDPRAYERVIEVYSTNKTIDRRSIIHALVVLGDPRGREVCISFLRDTYPSVRALAAEALPEFGGIAVIEPLIESLGDVNAEVRSTAARSLGILGFEKALEPLTALLDDKNEMVHDRAQEAIKAICKRKTR